MFYCDITAIYKYNLSRICDLNIGCIYKINKRLAIYYIAFYDILIGTLNKETIIYKCVGCNVIVAGTEDVDAVPVVAGIVACNTVVVGIAEADAVKVVVAGIVACNTVVAGIAEVDAVAVVADDVT